MIRQPERVQPYSLGSPRLGLDLLVAWCPAVPPILAQVGDDTDPHPAFGHVVGRHVLPFHLIRSLPTGLYHTPSILRRWCWPQAFCRPSSGVFARRDTVFSPTTGRSGGPMIGMASRGLGAG